MIHPPYIFRPLLGAGAIMAILLLGTWYWLPKLFPGFDPSEIGTVSADPSRATPPVLPNPGVGAPAQPASVAIRTSVPIATKPAAATSPEPAQQPVPAPTTAVADRAPAEVLTARSERDSKPAPPTLPTPDKANMSAHNSAYAGRGQDGLRLAHFKVQGSEDSSTIDGWVRAGLAVLEIRTDGASYVGEAGPQTGWRITPITRLSSDPRSQLRIVYPLGRAPIQRELLELLLVQNNILGARIVDEHRKGAGPRRRGGCGSRAGPAPAAASHEHLLQINHRSQNRRSPQRDRQAAPGAEGVPLRHRLRQAGQ
jgi:hypothetical protein